MDGLAATGRRRYDAHRARPILDDSASILAAAEQGHGLGLARWSLVAGDLASGRLVRPSTQSVRQHNSYYFVGAGA